MGPVTGDLHTFSDPNHVPSLLQQPATCDVSVLTFSGGWPEDLRRLAAGLASGSPAVDYEVLASANASPAVEAAIGDLAAADPRVRGLSFSQHVGFGAGRNAGILQARGSVVVVADTSVEPTGDALTPLIERLADPALGLAGAWGLVSADLRSFEEVPGSEGGGEVDALQAYWIAFRRAALTPDLLFDPKFTFYRNADIDLSLRWRAAGFRVEAVDLPLVRHAHREWEALGPEERERKSRDNFARLLRRWRERSDLLTGRAP